MKIYLFLVTDITDMQGEMTFLIKYENGYKFEKANDVKENFAELAVAYLEQNIKIE